MDTRTVRARLVIIVTLAGVAACGRSAPVAETVAPPPVVTVRAASIGTLRDTLSLPGTVVPAESAQFVVVAPQEAQLAESPLTEGAHVQAGDLLVRFELLSASGDLAAKQVELQTASDKLDAAKAEYAKQDALFAKGYVPRVTHDAAKAAVDRAQVSVEQIQTQVRVLSTVTERSVVRAPFAGVVVARWHNIGDTVQPSSTDPVLRLVDPTRVEISAQVTPAQLLRIIPGQAATVTPVGTSLSEPATVATRPAAGSPAATASVEVRLAFSGPTQLALQTGVVIEIILDERTNAVVVPLAAVIHKDDGTYVMVAGADGRAHRRDVRVGLETHDRAEIVSGVTSGDEVIVSGLDDVSDNGAIAIDRGR